MDDLTRIVAERAFFKGLPAEYVQLLVGCASNARYEPGAMIFRQGEAADRFFIVRHGQAVMEIPTPGRGAIQVDTVAEEDVLGFSWLYSPYQWHFDARATTLVRVLAFDAACLREKLEEDPRFGYEMMQRFSQVIIHRLMGARMQLLDMYGSGD